MAGSNQSLARKYRLAVLIAAREVIWHSPSGPRKVFIKIIRQKSARIELLNGEQMVVPVSELDLTHRWKARFKS